MKILDLTHYKHEDKPPYIYCGQKRMWNRVEYSQGALYNPFKASIYGDQIVPMYRDYLFKMLFRTPSIREALEEITEDSILAAWNLDLEGEAIFTREETCHTQIIWKAWRWLQRNKA